MNFFKNIFGKKEEPIRNYEDFWKWFAANSKEFYQVVKTQNNVEDNFIYKLSPKLKELREGFLFLTGMENDDTADLVLTADGNLKNIVFIEELVAAAPQIDNWIITCLKPPIDIDQFGISMRGFRFEKENIFFYSVEHEDYPDEIDITIIHDDYNEENKDAIINGVYIFLDNYIGELEFVQSIDNISFIEKSKAKKELVPIEKLKDFLKWRQKEFIEKYEGTRYNTENDSYSAYEGKVKDDKPLFAVINSQLLNWDKKASHPWMAFIDFQYEGHEDSGMPEESDYQLLNEIEEEIMKELNDFDGYLNVGRQTADNSREIFFACKDFRKPSKVFYHFQQKYSDKFEIEYNIYKDKYWQSFNRFSTH